MKPVIFLTPTLPYPPRNGGTMKSWNVVRYLAERRPLHVLTLLKRGDAEHEREFRTRVPLAGYASVAHDMPRSGAAFARSLAAGLPLTVWRNWTRALAGEVDRVARGPCVFVADHYLMYPYVDGREGRRVLHAHNAEHVLWSRMAPLADSALRRAAIALEAARVRRYEARIGRDADVVLAAPADAKALGRLGIATEKFRPTLHLGDESLLDLPPLDVRGTAPLLLYVGTLTWEANIEGLKWFASTQWPAIRRRIPEARFAIIGRDPDPRVRALAGNGIEVTGFVGDLEPWHREARALVCPLRAGSGIKVKIVNALYRGLPVVTTPVGAEGLESAAGLHVVSDGESWEPSIARLMADDAAWSAESASTRAWAREHLAWEPVLRAFDEALGDA